MRAFVDTSALLALSHRRDGNHRRAVEIAAKHAGEGGRWAGSVLVLAEFQAHLLHLRGPAAAEAAVGALVSDPAHEWHGVTPELVSDARMRWIRRFDDQAFSLADAVTFELMRREGITHAFAFDHHFLVAGFSLLQG